MDTARAPVSALARWVLAVATVLAVLGMHSLMSPGSATAEPAGHHDTSAAAVEHRATSGDTASTTVSVVGAPGADLMSGTHPPAAGAHECSGDCSGHGSGHQGHTLAHLCLAVLAGLLTVLVVLVVARVLAPALTSARRALVVPGGWRSPPWTHPCLAQLSVLRV